ncbi:MAG: bifunctional hydroxymethylpyrimidine kinase/phosphomethylpyrimidine kinase [Pseudomonadota bacterium]
MQSADRIRTEPVALTIAGSDSSGGAGIQADHKTFAALRVYGASVLTALTAQNTTGVQDVHAVPAAFVGKQLESVLSDLDVRAIKTGMLATAEIIEVVAATLRARSDIAGVVDPVMVATSGDPLIAADAIRVVRDQLVPTATLITPNLNEAAVLLDGPVAQDAAEMEGQAAALLDLGCRGVLLKGGHAMHRTDACDFYATAKEQAWICGERIATPNTHGTGCTLSSAIAAFLVRGESEREAIGSAKTYLTQALRSGAEQIVGAGAGPVDHLFAIRQQRA